MTPPFMCPGKRSDVHRGPVTQKHGQIFIAGVKLCNDDSMIMGGNCFYVVIISQTSLLG